MPNPSNPVPANPSQPPARTKRAPVLWAVFGFAGGLLPLIVFVASVIVARHTQPPTPLEPMANQTIAPNHAAPETPIAHQPLPAAEPTAPAGAALSKPATARRTPPATVVTPKQKVVALTPVSQAAMAPSSQAALASVDMNKIGSTATEIVSDHADETSAFPEEPETRVEPGPPPPVQSAKPSAPATRHIIPEAPPPNRVDGVIRDIIGQRWAQTGSTGVFPRSSNIRCTSGKKDIACWTNNLAGEHYTGPYRYKIKMILDKFEADGSFVMTYRELILRASANPAAAETEDINTLPSSIKIGWAPLIHRLPCQLRGSDRVVCRPVGEKQFVLNGTRLQTSANR